LIRTDADEVTYNLHVMLRFDFELALLEGKLAVKDLPEAWRERFKADLGIVPPDDRDGVLQDVHWYSGTIGGMFQGYTLGNILGIINITQYEIRESEDRFLVLVNQILPCGSVSQTSPFDHLLGMHDYLSGKAKAKKIFIDAFDH